MKKKADIEKQRRDFLKLAAAGTGAAITAASIGNTAVAAPVTEQAESQPVEQKGYHVTEHIKTYYDLARS